MPDPLVDVLVKVGLRPGHSAEFLRMYCPFHPNPSGKTLWVSHESGGWGCFSTRCPQHAGGKLQRLLALRGMNPRTADSVVRTLNLTEWERHEGPASLRDLDNMGRIGEAHVSCWLVDWFLAGETCDAVLRAGASAYDPARPVSAWAEGCPSVPGQTEHDCWEYLWYLLVTRTLRPHALDLLDVGFDRERGLLVFPVRGPGGEVRGVARRECRDGADYHLDGCVWRYGEENYQVVKIRRGDTFFGWSTMAERIEAGEPVVVVEGYADQLRLAGLGYAAVAKMGHTMTEEQTELLRSAPGPKILWPDDDRDGLRGCQVEAARLAATPGVGVVSYFGGVKDAGDSRVTAEVAGRIVASARPPAVWLADLPMVLAKIY